LSRSKREAQRPREILGKDRQRRLHHRVNSSDYSSDYSSSENKSGYRIKRRKKNNTGVVAASSANNKSSDKELSATIFAADRNVPITITNDATKQSNWFDEAQRVR
jgi:hypothetical protein